MHVYKYMIEDHGVKPAGLISSRWGLFKDYEKIFINRHVFALLGFTNPMDLNTALGMTQA